MLIGHSLVSTLLTGRISNHQNASGSFSVRWHSLPSRIWVDVEADRNNGVSRSTNHILISPLLHSTIPGASVRQARQEATSSPQP